MASTSHLTLTTTADTARFNRLGVALSRLQNDRHFDERKRGYGDHFGVWTRCPDSSCAQAFNALTAAGFFTDEQAAKRRRAVEAYYARQTSVATQ